MELILISESKLKIMLSESDLESFSLTSEGLDYENIDTREAFKCILDEAKVKTGFDTECGRLFIKVFPSKNGGCEVYVTKSGVEKERSQTKKGQSANNTANVKKEYCVFKIEDIDRVCFACRSVFLAGYRDESLLYYEEKGENRGVYYLVLQENCKGQPTSKKRRLPEKCDVANEFGKKLSSSEAYFYIKEHCREICPSRAVERMSSLT